MTPETGSEEPLTPAGRDRSGAGESATGVSGDSDATRAAMRAAAELEETRVASEPSAEPAPAADGEVEVEDETEADGEVEVEDELDDEEPSDEEPAADAPKRRRRRRRRGGASEEPAAPQPAPTRRRRPRRDPGAPIPVVRAQAKYVRSSARKARLVCDHIRGKSVEEARAILAVTPRAIARDWSKLLESAVANAEHNHELVGEDLYIKAVKADEGPTIKRFRPRAMGRASKIRKRTSHLTILLTPKE